MMYLNDGQWLIPAVERRLALLSQREEEKRAGVADAVRQWLLGEDVLEFVSYSVQASLAEVWLLSQPTFAQLMAEFKSKHEGGALHKPSAWLASAVSE